MKPRTRTLNRKQTSEELEKAGDYCIIEKLQTAAEKAEPYEAMVLKCPYCRLDMATTSRHKITWGQSWWRKWCGYPPVPTVSEMLQCPYVHSHRFTIKSGKVKPVK